MLDWNRGRILARRTLIVAFLCLTYVALGSVMWGAYHKFGDRPLPSEAPLIAADATPAPALKPVILSRQRTEPLLAQREPSPVGDPSLPDALQAWWANVKVLLASGPALPDRRGGGDDSDRGARQASVGGEPAAGGRRSDGQGNRGADDGAGRGGPGGGGDGNADGSSRGGSTDGSNGGAGDGGGSPGGGDGGNAGGGGGAGGPGSGAAAGTGDGDRGGGDEGDGDDDDGRGGGGDDGRGGRGDNDRGGDRGGRGGDNDRGGGRGDSGRGDRGRD